VVLLAAGLAVLLVGLAVGAALWLRPGESAMTVAQFGVLAQGHRIGGVDVPAAEYSDAKPTADLGEYGQIPAWRRSGGARRPAPAATVRGPFPGQPPDGRPVV
jgi:hypothetical protein